MFYDKYGMPIYSPFIEARFVSIEDYNKLLALNKQLDEWLAAAFEVHPNIDLDIAEFRKNKENNNGTGE